MVPLDSFVPSQSHSFVLVRGGGVVQECDKSGDGVGKWQKIGHETGRRMR